MTASWGPAFDAEVAYRHEQVRAHFGRRSWRRWFRRSAPVGATAVATAQPAPVAIATRRVVADQPTGAPTSAAAARRAA